MSRKIIHNSLYNILGNIFPLFSILITVPLYLKTIGEAKYGILALAWLILGYFNVLDLGIGKAVANKVASVKGLIKDQVTIFWGGFLLSLSIGVFISVICYLGFPQLIKQLNIKEPEVYAIFTTLRLEICLTLVVLILTSSGIGYLEGQENFKLLNLVNVFRDLLFQWMPLLTALYFTTEIVVLIKVTILARIISTTLLFTSIGFLNVKSFILPSKEKILSLVKFGSSVAVTNTLSPVLSGADRFIIGAISGASAVTIFTVPYNMVMKLNILPLALNKALFPQFSSIEELGANSLADKAIKRLFVLMSSIILIGVLFVDYAITLWIDEGFASTAAPVAQVLLIGILFNSIAYVPLALIQGQGRPKQVAIIHALEALPYLLLLWYLTQEYGVIGAAATWTARVFIDSFLLIKNSRMSIKVFLHACLMAVLLLLLVFGSNDWINVYFFYPLILVSIGFLIWSVFYVFREIKNYIKPLKTVE